MPKENGLGWTTLTVDNSSGVAKNIKNDVTNFEFSTPRAVQDSTGVDMSGIERILLLADFSATLNGVFNDAADRAHETLKTISSTSVVRTMALAHSGQTLSNEVIGTDYQLTRSATGEFTWSAPFVLADGTVPTWS